ncbi:MAG TPA: hypothetical protein PLD33_05730 [Anaerolineales bacterium]|nr:hypothetical protein [Anaerolineales bacterium]
MKNILFAVFLLGALAACTPTQPTMTNAQSTAAAVAWTQVNLTLDAMPTDTPTVTPTATPPIFILPSPSPTSTPWQFTFPTPNAIQVENWKEYQSELAKILLPDLPPQKVLCEWEIIGQNKNDLYILAVCDTVKGGNVASAPVLLHLNSDETIQSAETPGVKSDYNSDINKMFPKEIQAILNNYPYERRMNLLFHLDYRQRYSQVPPLNIQSVVPTPSQIPVRPSFPIVTPNSIQLEKWKEYQSKLAKAVYAEYYPFISANNALCEWDILGQDEKKVYVFAVCYDGITTFAVIYLDANGSALKADIPRNNESRDLFPEDISKIFFFAMYERTAVLLEHLEYRQSNPNIPPLVVLSAIPTATPTP